MGGDSFLWSVEASADLVSSFKEIGNVFKNVSSYFGGGIFQVFSDITSGKMIKQIMVFNSEMRRLGLSMGYTATQSKSIESSTMKIGYNLGTGFENASKITQALTKMRVKAEDMTAVGTSVGQFSDITGASAESTAKFSGNLMKLGKDSSQMKSVLTGIANVGNQMGLTQEGMEGVLETSGELTLNLLALGASTSSVKSMAEMNTKLASTFEMVGLSASRANEWISKVFNPDNFAENIVMMNKLGISAQQYQGILNGNASAQTDMNNRLAKLGGEVKNLMKISPIAASAYAKIWGGGLSASELIRLSSAKVAKDKQEQEMQRMWGATTGTAQKNLDKLNGKMQMFFMGVMMKMEKPITMIVDKMTQFFNKVDWNKVSSVMGGFIDKLTDFLQTGDLSGFLKYVGSGLVKLLDFAVTQFKKLLGNKDLLVIIGNLFKNIGDMIGNVAQKMFDTMMESDNLKGLAQGFKFVGGVVKTLVENIPLVIGAIVAFQVVKAISEGLLTAALWANVAATSPIAAGMIVAAGAFATAALPFIAIAAGLALIATSIAVSGNNIKKLSNSKGIEGTIGSAIVAGLLTGLSVFILGPIGFLLVPLFTGIAVAIKDTGKRTIERLDKQLKISDEMLKKNTSILVKTEDPLREMSKKYFAKGENALNDTQKKDMLNEFYSQKQAMLDNTTAVIANTDELIKNNSKALKSTATDILGKNWFEFLGKSDLAKSFAKLPGSTELKSVLEKVQSGTLDVNGMRSIKGAGSIESTKTLLMNAQNQLTSKGVNMTEGDKQLFEVLNKTYSLLESSNSAIDLKNRVVDFQTRMKAVNSEEEFRKLMLQYYKEDLKNTSGILKNTEKSEKAAKPSEWFFSKEGNLRVEKETTNAQVLALKSMEDHFTELFQHLVETIQRK